VLHRTRRLFFRQQIATINSIHPFLVLAEFEIGAPRRRGVEPLL
jgi:hypothetical protein